MIYIIRPLLKDLNLILDILINILYIDLLLGVRKNSRNCIPKYLLKVINKN